MAHTTQQIRNISPKVITFLLLAFGLMFMVYALIFQKILLFAIIVGLPLGVIILTYSIQRPRMSYLLYGAYTFYLTAIMRYSRQDGLSVISDGLLIYMTISILFYYVKNKNDIRLSNAINFFTVTYIAWFLYILIQFINTASDSTSYIAGIRGWLLSTPILYFVSCILLDNPKTLKRSLIIIGIFTITAFLKLLYQKYRWFDAAETEWLMGGSWYTHILSSGIRYFSIYSDAGNFGSNMGMISIVYGIIAFHTSEKWLRIFFSCIALMGIVGMIMSGTRGAMIVPLGGLALYCLICKNIKIMVISALAVIMLYAFFAFTEIGDGNALIRRMRTAFRPQEDTSFNVRIENQKLIAEYMRTHPWGAGLGKGVARVNVNSDGVVEDTIPPDAFYVDIWIQTGTIGLLIYISMCIAIIIYSCYIIMFRVRNPGLRNILTAFICGVFGIWLNGYVGRGMGMTPSFFMVAASLAFIMNGPYIDRLLRESKSEILNTKH